MACNMDGLGFIDNNKAECKLSPHININFLRSCKINQVKKYLFSSSACIYNTNLQKEPFIKGLKEENAYSPIPKMVMGRKNCLVKLLDL